MNALTAWTRDLSSCSRPIRSFRHPKQQKFRKLSDKLGLNVPDGLLALAARQRRRSESVQNVNCSRTARVGRPFSPGGHQRNGGSAVGFAASVGNAGHRRNGRATQRWYGNPSRQGSTSRDQGQNSSRRKRTSTRRGQNPSRRGSTSRRRNPKDPCRGGQTQRRGREIRRGREARKALGPATLLREYL